MTASTKNWWEIPNLINDLIRDYGKDVTRSFLREKFKHKENKMAFACICFSHHLVSRSPEFHQQSFDLFSSPNNTCEAAPRGFAKSTIVMIDDAFDIVNAYRHYIVKISDSYTQALEHTDTLQYELENNEILKWLYGDLKTDNWSSGEFITSTGVKVVAKGQGMKIRGLKFNQYRPDKIEVDDLENDELVESPERRNKLKRWWKMGVLPALAKGGKINMVGTVLHHDALLAKIVNKTDEFMGWETLKFKALNEGSDGQYSLWPEMLSVEELIRMRDDPTHPRYMGSIAFSQEMQNEPMSDEDAVIKRTWIKYQDNVPGLKRKIIVVDPAISKKEKADNAGIQCWGLGLDNNVYCIEKIVGKFSFTELGTEIRAMFQRHNTDVKIDKVIIEEVAYQSALKEHELLKSLPVVGITPEKDKRTRLVVVSKWFEAGVVYFKSSMESLIEELVNFGSMAHDDEMDCATYAINELKNETDKMEISFA
jgi:predicted phage terminase large subunit-like protein